MKRSILPLLAALLILASGELFATTESQRSAINELGQLNGVALNCHHQEQMQLMKKAMVDTVPRIRALGELFDQATNDEFVIYNSEQRLCPVKSEFKTAVAEAITKLKNSFKRDK